MSDLLEQAIIDAAALKEAAIKNAENTLVEKYSQEFKDTVQKLLEQETAVAGAPPMPADPTTLAADNSSLEANSSQELQTSSLETDKKDAFSDVKSAFLDGPDDELITINFDQLKSTMMEMFDIKESSLEEEYDRAGTRTEDVAKDALAAGVPFKEQSEIDEADVLELAEEELQEYDLEEDDTYPSSESVETGLEEMEIEEEQIADPALAAKKADLSKRRAQIDAEMANVDATAAKKASAPTEEVETSMEEEIELTEEELSELAEELRVDLKPESQGRGYMGSTNVEKQRLIDVERAAARDEKAVKEREEEVKKLADLVKENTELKNLNQKMLSMFESLKLEVQKINVSNAKLLYTNKALGNVSLNERQKNAIVESISKADSVLEAKTIYETLQNAVENADKKQEAPQTLRETLNRAQSPFVVKKAATNNINDVMTERMKALAGIKLNK